MRDAPRLRALSTLYPVAARSGCTNIPLATGRAQEDDTILEIGIAAMACFDSSTGIRQDQLGSWEISESDERAASDGLQDCPFDDDTGAYIFP